MKAFFQKIYNTPWLFAVVVVALAVALLVLVADKLVMPAIAGQFTSEVATPDVLGMSEEEAAQKLLAAGLDTLWAPEGNYSPTVPLGRVLTQAPAPGRLVKEGREIYLTISKGVQEVELPNLRGKSRRQAEIVAQRLGLVLASKDVRRPDPTLSRNIVIGLEPLKGGTVRVGDTVRLLLSNGSKISVPGLVGLSEEAALKKLDSLHFGAPKVSYQADSTQLPRTVLSQEPEAGETLSSGGSVRLVVAE
jgi:serine/threonine-protein kinase